jgi:mannan endo-1,4-beta-mannosidase
MMTAPRSWTAGLVVAWCLLLVAVFGFARAWPRMHSASEPPLRPRIQSGAEPNPTRSSGIYLGISVHQWSTADLLINLSRYQALARKNAAMVMYWRDWAASGAIDPKVVKAIYGQASIPIISWEPGSYRVGSGQSKYSLASIITGKWDRYIRHFARALRSYRRSVLLRFAHEMNGNWYRWCGQPKEYVAAWRHVHGLFEAEGARNVKWVWSPNVNWDGLHPFEPYYPGDAYVDWLGLDGYNRPRTGWNPFTQIFRVAYQSITALSDKPVMIAETGTAEPTAAEAAAGDTKAKWIMDLYRAAVPSMPRIRAVVWFDVDESQKDATGAQGYDNRIETSPQAEQAFPRAVAPRFYHSRWP